MHAGPKETGPCHVARSDLLGRSWRTRPRTVMARGVLSHTSLADRGDPFRDHLYAREPWVLTPTHQQPNLGRRNKTCRFSRWRAGSHRRSWQRPRQTWMPRNPGFWSLRRRCSSPSEGGSRATRPAPRAAGSGREQKRHMPRAAEPRVLRVRECGSDAVESQLFRSSSRARARLECSAFAWRSGCLLAGPADACCSSI
jgi:hypothetical protein